jgi:hypothetical protein
MPNTASSYVRMLEIQRAAAAQRRNGAKVAELNSMIAEEKQRAANQRAANQAAAQAQGHPTSRKSSRSRRSRRNRKHRRTTRRRT